MLPHYAIKHRTVVGFCVFLTILGGIWSYFQMGRLEDPEFSIRTALVVTIYPGANADEVERLVTNVVERAARQIKGFEKVRSISKPGMSFVLVDLVDTIKPTEMPDVWQDLRNKLQTAKLDMPAEALPSVVKDDFGDVYGIVLALSGDGFSKAELRDRAKEMQKELALVDQVRRVELWGVPEERIEVEISHARMKELNIHPLAVILALQNQNLTVDSGNMTIGDDLIRVAPYGHFQTMEEIGDLLLPDGSATDLIQLANSAIDNKQLSSLLDKLRENKGDGSRQIRLRDISTIRRVLKDEPSQIMRSNGKDAIAISLSPIPNGNVIKMGELVREKVAEISDRWPAGFHVDVISYQPENVVRAIDGFMKNLREAIIIVTLVVMLAMGWRSGLLITSSLLIVILGTFCVLAPMGMVLHRASLGAFIIALGILVDDAVVVGDLILVRMQRGASREDACIEGAQRASHQLLGATVVGALAFWPIYLSPNDTGQYAGSVFVVLGISLMISWFVAMLQTPVIYYLCVKNPPKCSTGDPHGGPVYMAYRRMLERCLHHKTITLGLMLILLVLAGYGFTYIPQIFFPRAIRSQFMIDYWLPEGTSINSVSSDVAEIEQFLKKQEGVTDIGSFIGAGPPRFYLPYEPELPNSSYAQLVVNVTSPEEVDKVLPIADKWVSEHFPQAQTRVQRFALGPTTKQEVEVRISGPDKKVLRELADKVQAMMSKEPDATFIRNNWREKVPTWTPEYSQAKGARAAISRNELLFALRWATTGIPIAHMGDNENLLPIFIRSLSSERNNTEMIESAPVWGKSLGSIPLSQVTEQTKLTWEDGQIHRRNRIPTMTVGADAVPTSDWSTLVKKLKPKVEELSLPDGYRLEWGGQFEQSTEATKELMGKLPVALVFMMIIVVALFNSIRQPLIIVLTFPLATIGITLGMLLLRMPFGFMALVGAMSLLGMMVRNGVVLMGQIDEELASGESPYRAIVDASVERMRPVTVAAMTVIVGMIPLLRDPLFDSMATAIMFGLIFATVLTLFVVPVLYMIVFGIKAPQK